MGSTKKSVHLYLLTGFSADIVQGNFNSGLGNTGTIIEFTCTKEMFMTIRRGLSGNFQRMPSVVDILREGLMKRTRHRQLSITVGGYPL